MNERMVLRLHAELYQRLVDCAEAERRTKSAMLAVILRRGAGELATGPDTAGGAPFSAWSEVYRAQKGGGGQAHTAVPSLSVRVDAETALFIQAHALYNGESVQAAAQDLVVRFFHEGEGRPDG